MPSIHCPTAGSVLDAGFRSAEVEPGPTTSYRCCTELACSPWVAFDVQVVPEPDVIQLFMWGILLLVFLRNKLSR